MFSPLELTRRMLLLAFFSSDMGRETLDMFSTTPRMLIPASKNNKDSRALRQEHNMSVQLFMPALVGDINES